MLLCHRKGLVFWQIAAGTSTAHQVTRVLTRLDSIEIQALVDQLPDGLVALG